MAASNSARRAWIRVRFDCTDQPGPGTAIASRRRVGPSLSGCLGLKRGLSRLLPSDDCKDFYRLCKVARTSSSTAGGWHPVHRRGPGFEVRAHGDGSARHRHVGCRGSDRVRGTLGLRTDSIYETIGLSLKGRTYRKPIENPATTFGAKFSEGNEGIFFGKHRIPWSRDAARPKPRAEGRA